MSCRGCIKHNGIVGGHFIKQQGSDPVEYGRFIGAWRRCGQIDLAVYLVSHRRFDQTSEIAFYLFNISFSFSLRIYFKNIEVLADIHDSLTRLKMEQVPSIMGRIR
ncbi:Uncharacterised protein [Mycobacteroides abscessus subsp. abscessus]|nr:Uncharacterised protein [Mycobacteroides abscessus subsp. abscessus]